MSDDMDTGALLADQLHRLFADSVSRESLNTVERSTPAAGLWDQLEALGLPLALVPEEVGGAGLAWAEVEPAFRTLGEHVAPAPLGETMIAAQALAAAGLAIPAGPLTLATAPMTMDAEGLVNGTDPLVPWVPQADHIVLVARQGDASVLCLFERASLDCTPQETIGRNPGGRIVLNGVRPLQAAPYPDGGALGLLPQLAALRAVQIAGALDRVLMLCVEYGNTRVQFGKPIGKFQAVQHMIAELASHTAAAQVAGLYACRRIDAGDAEHGAAVAKSRAGKAATRGAEIAHQVFGAIGVTDEHILHHYTRRLWQWRTEAGSDPWWAERLGRRALAAGGAALWPAIAG